MPDFVGEVRRRTTRRIGEYVESEPRAAARKPTLQPKWGFAMSSLYARDLFTASVKRPQISALLRTRRGRWLLGIILLGALLRFPFLSYGLPGLYQEDEEFFVTPAIRVAQGALNPHWFGAPGQPLIYATAAEFRLLNKIVNTANGTQWSVLRNYQAYLTLFQSVGRVLPVLAGLAMIAGAYLLGRRWHERAGLFAALLVATSFYLADQSLIIRPDVLQTALLLLALSCLLRVLDEPRRVRWYVWMGAALGVATSVKYPSLFLVPTLCLAAFLLVRRGQFVLRHWCAAAGAAVTATFLTGPYLFLDFHRVLRYVGVENRASHGGHDRLGFLGNVWWYVAHTLGWEAGTLQYALTIVVIILLVVRWLHGRRSARATAMLVLLFAAVSYLLLTSALRLHWFRWVMPVMALLFVFTAVGLHWIATRLRERHVLLATILAVLFLAPAIRLGRTLYGYAHPYTVESARTWILANVPKGSFFATEPLVPELPKEEYTTFLTHNLSWYPPSYYRGLGATHFMFTGRVHGVIVQEAERLGPQSNFANAVRGYERLLAEGELVFAIEPHPAYTDDNLLYANDASVLRTLDFRLRKGTYVRVYRFR